MKYATVATLFASSALAQKQYQAVGFYSKNNCEGTLNAYAVLDYSLMLNTTRTNSNLPKCMGVGCLSESLGGMTDTPLTMGLSMTCTSNEPDVEVKQKMGNAYHLFMTLYTDDKCGKKVGSQGILLDQCISMGVSNSIKATIRNNELQLSSYNQSDKCEGTVSEQTGSTAALSGSCTSVEAFSKAFNQGSVGAAGSSAFVSGKFEVVKDGKSQSRNSATRACGQYAPYLFALIPLLASL